jgi:tetratricopeptide (TPR) repeat protein
MPRVRRLVLTGLFLFGALALSAQSPRTDIVVEPEGFLPLRASADQFTFGAGGALALIVDPDPPVYLEGRIGYTWIPTIVNTNLNMISGTVGGGLRLDIGSIGAFRLGAGVGGFLGTYNGLSAFNPTFAARTSLQFSIGDAMRVGVGAGYIYHVGEISTAPFGESALAEGMTFSIGTSFSPRTAASGPRRPRIEIQEPRYGRLFPVFYQYYNDSPLGSVTITNGEREPITDVKVSLLVNQYMDAPKVSATIDRMAPGESVEVPILGLFRDSILSVTEVTSVASELIVEYEVDDELLTADRADTLTVLNRNSMTWDDDRKAAAFVTANDPTVQRFARNITSSVRSEGTTAVNEQLRTAMALFHALKLHGMDYVIDPDSSYIELSEDSNQVDYLQFPQQSLDFRTGDCDDLSILYSSLLESVGIRTAFVTIPGHIFMAFAMNMDEREARLTYRRPEDLIFYDNEAWVPVEITMVREDFLSAWDTGAKQWRENDAAGTAAFYPVREAWSTYLPTAFASEPLPIDVPQTTEVVPVYNRILDEFIDRELGPQIAELNERIEASNGNPRLINRLGTLYARYGRYEEAEQEFRRALATRDFFPAVVNLGNIHYIRGEIDRALEMFDRAQSIRGDDPTVLISLARTHFDLEQYVPAAERYREVEVLDPELASEFAYIVNENRDSGRASAAQSRSRVIWDEE